MRTIVSENVGSSELRDLPRAVVDNSKTMYAIARRALEILKILHENGLIHGDIHRRNWLVSDVSRPSKTLRLIDFGRVAPYIDLTTGKHILDRPKPWTWKFTGWNERLLSPWEIQGGKKSRRDDIFRLAEMFLFMIGGPVDKWFRNEAKELKESFLEKLITKEELLRGIVELKFERSKKSYLDRKIHKLFSDFYAYSLVLEFKERPDYERWIGLFGKN
jgi:serine/threonine protein kinase